MMYGKLMNGVLFTAQKMLIINGEEVWFPSQEQYAEQGYKPVMIDSQPSAEAGYHAEIHWSETDDSIEGAWTVVQDSDEPTAEEVLAILTGESE